MTFSVPASSNRKRLGVGGKGQTIMPFRFITFISLAALCLGGSAVGGGEQPEANKVTLVSLELRDADIREVVDTLAQQTRLDFIVAPDVQGRVGAVKLVDISVEDALDVLLAAVDAVYEKRGDIYVIKPRPPAAPAQETPTEEPPPPEPQAEEKETPAATEGTPAKEETEKTDQEKEGEKRVTAEIELQYRRASEVAEMLGGVGLGPRLPSSRRPLVSSFSSGPWSTTTTTRRGLFGGTETTTIIGADGTTTTTTTSWGLNPNASGGWSLSFGPNGLSGSWGPVQFGGSQSTFRPWPGGGSPWGGFGR